MVRWCTECGLAVVAVRPPVAPSLVVQGSRGPFVVPLFDRQGRRAVSNAALVALADAIIAGPQRPGSAGAQAADAAHQLREMAVA